MGLVRLGRKGGTLEKQKSACCRWRKDKEKGPKGPTKKMIGETSFQE